jgi:coenzyme F420 hydrogenase subunit beta
MIASNGRGQCELVDKVISQGICVKCGACVNLCPYFDYFDGRIVVTDDCHADTWRCLQVCPRADHDDISLDQESAAPGDRSEIGPFKEIFIGRAKEEEIRVSAQYGGFVSSLLVYALGERLIRSAILTDKGKEISPGGVIAKDRADILKCAGSRYSAAAGLAALNRAIKDDKDKLAVVGLPCQMEALARMRLMDPDGEERDSRVSLKIGLFCTWALDYRKLRDYLKTIGIDGPIQKYDIPPPPAQIFQIQTEQGCQEFPIDEIRPSIQEGCGLCQDMTAEWADISVGTVEGMVGWNTVVVRSERGSQLLSEFIEAGLIETRILPEENLAHLKEASLNKRERGELAKEERRRKKT